jgi:cytochrome c551/c552
MARNRPDSMIKTVRGVISVICRGKRYQMPVVTRKAPPYLVRRLLLASALATTLRIAGASASESGEQKHAAPTFTRNVAPILFKNCVPCHRADGSAAGVPLISYEAVKLKAKDVQDQVVRREMPPWPADASQSLPFQNDPRLSQHDIDTLVDWVAAGTPKGSDADLPPEPVFAKGWLSPDGRMPDAIVSLPKFTVRANGTIPYIQKLIKVPYAEDKWISALQVRAGNPVLLHHMGITEIALPEGMTPESLASMDSVASQIGAPSGKLKLQQAVVTDPVNPGAYDMLGVYTPGTTFETYGEGNGKLLKGGKNVYLNLNIHYTTTDREETDLSQIGLWFEPTAPKHLLYRFPAAVDAIIANGRELLTDDPGTKAEGTGYALPPIPANGQRYELIGMSAYREPITIYQLQPHAHVRAVDFKYVAVYPDGHEISILSVPHYSYHFQLEYELATPLNLPAGSKLIVTGHYDNSSKNDHLQHLGASEAARKCGPENVAYFGQQNQSWDEMFSPLVQYAADGKHAEPLKLVSVVGCPVHSASGGWNLQQASRAKPTDQQGTSSTELSANQAIPLGSEHYRLLGTDVFRPARFVGSKLVVKGVLIPTAHDPRINVTSMQPTRLSCPN